MINLFVCVFSFKSKGPSSFYEIWEHRRPDYTFYSSLINSIFFVYHIHSNLVLFQTCTNPQKGEYVQFIVSFALWNKLNLANVLFCNLIFQSIHSYHKNVDTLVSSLLLAETWVMILKCLSYHQEDIQDP